MRHCLGAAILVSLLGVSRAVGVEPNETFATATLLSPGVLSVADELTPASFPDTVLGIRDHFGQVYFVDDDGSPVGDRRASGVGGVPTNSGSIDFSVSGWPDDTFFGNHSESGYYEVFLDVYDFFDDLVDQFSEIRLLEPGVFHDFNYSDFEWNGGSYDVYIDNTVGPSDVDFFTFTGLTPGASFSARTLDPDTSLIDTYLGWFNSTGMLLAVDDDSGGGSSGLLSLLQGTVPANGRLTFAVTGHGDVDFIGDHAAFGTYELRLAFDAAPLPGDYNGDNNVNAADYVLWRKNNGTQAGYNQWRDNFGQSLGNGVGANDSANAAVPEPITIALLGLAVCGLAMRAARQARVRQHDAR